MVTSVSAMAVAAMSAVGLYLFMNMTVFSAGMIVTVAITITALTYMILYICDISTTEYMDRGVMHNILPDGEYVYVATGRTTASGNVNPAVDKRRQTTHLLVRADPSTGRWIVKKSNGAVEYTRMRDKYWIDEDPSVHSVADTYMSESTTGYTDLRVVAHRRTERLTDYYAINQSAQTEKAQYG